MDHDIQERPDEQSHEPGVDGGNSEHRAEGSDDDPSLRGALVALATFAFPVLWVPGFIVPSWTARVGLLIVVAAAGAPWLVATAMSRRAPLAWPARAGLGLAAVSTLSAWLSDNRNVGFFGNYAEANGAVWILGLVSAWALGASIEPRDRPLVQRCLVLGVGLSLAVAVLQGGVDLGSINLDRGPGGRVSGLLGNPVHVGILGAAVVSFGGGLLVRRQWWGVALVGLGAAAVEVGGGRASLLVALGAVAVVLFRKRWAVAGLVAIALVAGTAGGALLASRSGAATASSRLGADAASTESMLSDAGGNSAYRYRLQLWWSARHAIAERPVLGVGPGQFRGATSPFHTREQVASIGADTLFSDAHNIVVEYATTTGLLGVAALLAWLGLALRRAQGAMRWFGAAILIGYLFQPSVHSTMATAALTLGAAAATTACRRRPAWPVVTATTLAGVVAAATFVTADWWLRQGILDFDLADAERADALLPRWSFTAGVVTGIVNFDARVRKLDEALPVARFWREEAIRRDPANPRHWYLHGHEDIHDGRLDSAERHFQEALERNPYSAQSAFGLGRVADLRGDRVGAIRWFRTALEWSPDDPVIEAFLRRVERRAPGELPPPDAPFPGLIDQGVATP